MIELDNNLWKKLKYLAKPQDQLSHGFYLVHRHHKTTAAIGDKLLDSGNLERQHGNLEGTCDQNGNEMVISQRGIKEKIECVDIGVGARFHHTHSFAESHVHYHAGKMRVQRAVSQDPEMNGGRKAGNIMSDA